MNAGLCYYESLEFKQIVLLLGLDTTFHIAKVSPELAQLVRRAKAIHAVTGGSVDPSAGARAASFEEKRDLIRLRIQNFDQLIEQRDEKGVPKDSRDHIRIKTQVRKEMMDIQKDVKGLMDFHKHEMDKKKKKVTPEELAVRLVIFKELSSDIKQCENVAAGRPKEDVTDDTTHFAASMTVADLSSGATLSSGPRQAMSAEQKMKMEMIDREVAEQDQILDRLSAGLDSLKDTTLKIKDELDTQAVMIEDLDKRVDKAQTKLDKVNSRMEMALKLADDKASNFCTYVICFALVLGLATVAYNLIK